MVTLPDSQTARLIGADQVICITQDEEEHVYDSVIEYLAVCTLRADLLACSIHCEDTGCGGHPICQSCYELGVERGLIREVA